MTLHPTGAGPRPVPERPRLGYLLKKFPRLSETFVLGEILWQERLGQRIHVFSRRGPDEEPRHPEFAALRAEVEQLPSVRSIDPWGEIFSGGDDGELLDTIRKAYAGVRGLGLERLPALMAEAIYLRRRCRELSIGHLHVHFATEAAVTAMILRDLGGPSFSVTAHAKDIYRSTVDPVLLDRVVRSAAFVVTGCDANLVYLRERLSSAAGDRLRRLYNGIDLSSFRVVRRPEPGRILSVGRMVEKKGFEVLIEAFGLMREAGVDFRAVIAGDGERREDLGRRVAELRLEPWVDMPGALDQDGVRALMGSASIFCLPCVIGADGNRDALPTVLIEAQAAGIPIISTPVTGIPEILDGGRAGELVPCGDPVATAEMLTALLADEARAERLAQAGRERAAALFDRDVNARVLHGWFEECMEAAACASST